MERNFSGKRSKMVGLSTASLKTTHGTNFHSNFFFRVVGCAVRPRAVLIPSKRILSKRRMLREYFFALRNVSVLYFVYFEAKIYSGTKSTIPTISMSSYFWLKCFLRTKMDCVNFESQNDINDIELGHFLSQCLRFSSMSHVTCHLFPKTSIYRD